MSKAVKCPSCRMKGKLNGEDYALVATHRGRPVVQCFWCDSQVHVPRLRRPVLIDVEPMFEAVFEFKRAIGYDSLIELMALEEDDHGDRVEGSIFAPPTEASNGRPEATGKYSVEESDGKSRRSADIPEEENVDFAGETAEPAPLRESVASPDAHEEAETYLPDAVEEPAEPNVFQPAAFEAPQERPRESEPATFPIEPGVHNLLQLADHVGWLHPRNSRYEPEFMNIQLPPRRPMTPRQESWHEFRMMMKYFQIDGGSKEQKQREATARRMRMDQAKQLRRQQRRLRLDLRKFETGEAI